jgi:hypothetical protein
MLAFAGALLCVIAGRPFEGFGEPEITCSRVIQERSSGEMSSHTFRIETANSG